jgi:predicted Zn-dependent protease
MKRLDLLPLTLLVAVLGFVGVQAAQAPRISAAAGAAVLEPAPRATSARKAAKRLARAKAAVLPTTVMAAMDVAEVKERLRQRESGTYIGEILLQRDSALARWPERTVQPLRVWIGDGSLIKGWDPVFAQRVREAFTDWSGLGIPVRFTFVVDSSDADIKVRWIPRFDEPISGKTLWARDRHWWIVNSGITLALYHNGNRALDASAIKAIALHEIGHLLGLDHTADTANIMTARVRVRELSDADRATVRLLYSLPPGSIKAR